LDRRGDRPGAVRRGGRARLPDRRPPPRFFRKSTRFWAHGSANPECGGEHWGGVGVVADERPAAAVPQLRWLGADGDHARGGAASGALAHDGLRMRMVVAGGGTGGHLFPGLAVAECAAETSHVLFVGSAYGIEARVIPQTRFGFRAI